MIFRYEFIIKLDVLFINISRKELSQFVAIHLIENFLNVTFNLKQIVISMF